MEISTIGLDLAKNVFQIHGVDAKGEAEPEGGNGGEAVSGAGGR